MTTYYDVKMALEEEDGYYDVCDIRISKIDRPVACSRCGVELRDEALVFNEVYAYGKMRPRMVCLNRRPCRKRGKKRDSAKIKTHEESVRNIEEKVKL